ncbi:MAG: SPFH domain-containing protein [Candidatus Bathyarchaeia archaeon]|jgi:regulator of protease activity HflC (stomatin/prohibitin superfamily)
MADAFTLGIASLIALVVIAILVSGIKVLKEWERAPLLMLGRYRGLKGPGIIYVPPFIGNVPFIISTRLQVVSFKTEQSLTRDNIPVAVDSVMYFQPVDLQKVILNVNDFNQATQLAAQTTLREVIGQASFDELLTERERVGNIARGIIDSKTENWGIKVTAVEIRDVGIPQALQDAMSRQAQAERERRARVTLSLAEYESAEKMVQAANMYKDNDRAFELRWMNIVYELGLQGKNLMILIPSNIPTAGPGGQMSMMGIYGVNQMPKPEGEATQTPPKD